jgi:hypothetical protein
VVTAFKIAEERETMILRVLNLGPKTVTGEITAGFGIGGAWLTNLAEERQSELRVMSPRTVEAPVRPRQLVTVELEKG